MDANSSGTNATVGSLVLGFSNLRETRNERPMVVSGGDGVFIVDENGKRYIEANSSFYCAALGYSNERLVAAAEKQMREMPFYVSGLHRTVPVAMELAERLAELAPVKDAHVAFGSSGSEANDFLIKFIRYRNVFLGEPQKRKIISRLGGYHGGTNMTASLGGSKSLHDSFALNMDDHIFISQPNYPQNAEEGESQDEFVNRLVLELEEAIISADPGTVAAFIAEPICFAAGFYLPPATYFTRVQEVLKRHGVLFIDDEVITGFCRTGNMFGAETFELEPDCVTTAKGMSAAFFPISSLIMSGDIYNDLERHCDEHGFFAHGSTYSAHPVGAAVALEVLNIIEDTNMLEHVRARSQTFAQRMNSFRQHPLVEDVRTCGLSGAIQLRSEQRGGGATAALTGPSKLLAAASVDRGVLIRMNGPNAIFCPPLIISDDEIEEMFQRFEAALGDVEAEKAA